MSKNDDIIRARKLRRRHTEAEKCLWSRLRRRQLCGFKFRRRHPVGPYIVDFICQERNLVIEVDGGQHAEKDEASRNELLQLQGLETLRFWNTEVLGNLDGVLQTISMRLAAGP